MKKLIGFLLVTALVGCDSRPAQDGGTQTGKISSSDTVVGTTAKNNTNQTENDISNTPTIGTDGLIHIDTDKLKTGIKPADIKTYPYPFATDSEPVKNYAKEYKITPEQAQLAMTLSMASPEALNKVLDQIVGEYVGHSLIDGANMSLVIYTSDKVAPMDFGYVIADKFGEGLVLPIKVMPASQIKDKPQIDTQKLTEKFHPIDATEK